MPTSAVPRELANADRGRTTVVFAGHLLHFARPLIEHLRSDPRYDVLVDSWQGHSVHDESSSESCLDGADVIFCEWCLGNAVWYSKRKRPGQRLLVRLHRQEYFGSNRPQYLEKVDWEAVDAAIAIAPYFRDELRATGLVRPERVHLIPNLFDTARFERPKPADARFELGVVKYTPMRKRPDLAIEIFERLKDSEPRFRLTFVDKSPDLKPWVSSRPTERAFLTRFLGSLDVSRHRSSISFHDHTDDMPAWFSRIGILLSTSDSEGSHQAVAEGMASGAVPIIRNWPGADRLYPSRYVFTSVDQAVERIRWATDRHRFRKLSVLAKNWACSRFDTRFVAPRIIQLFQKPRHRSGHPG